MLLDGASVGVLDTMIIKSLRTFEEVLEKWSERSERTDRSDSGLG